MIRSCRAGSPRWQSVSIIASSMASRVRDSSPMSRRSCESPRWRCRFRRRQFGRTGTRPVPITETHYASLVNCTVCLYCRFATCPKRRGGSLRRGRGRCVDHAPDTDQLRVWMRDDELHAPMLLDFEVVPALRGLTIGGELECPLLTRDSRLARSSGHDVRIEVQ